MVYLSVDGHPSRHLPSPLLVNFVDQSSARCYPLQHSAGCGFSLEFAIVHAGKFASSFDNIADAGRIKSGIVCIEEKLNFSAN